MAYDVLPKGYPFDCTDGEIKKTIRQLQEEILGNSRIESIVSNRSTLIQLGQNELAGRFTKITVLLSLGISILSLIMSYFAIINSGGDGGHVRQDTQLLEGKRGSFDCAQAECRFEIK